MRRGHSCPLSFCCSLTLLPPFQRNAELPRGSACPHTALGFPRFPRLPIKHLFEVLQLCSQNGRDCCAWLLDVCRGVFGVPKNFRVRHSPAPVTSEKQLCTKRGCLSTPSSLPLNTKAAFSFNIKSYQPNETCQRYII